MNLKSQKGAVTLFVLVSCMFFLASVVSVQMYMQSKQMAVDKEYRQIKANYEKDINNIDLIYTEASNKNNLSINFGIPEFDKTKNKILVDVATNLDYSNVGTIKYGWYSSTENTETPSINQISNWTYVEYERGENEFIANTELSENDRYYYLCVLINNKETWKKMYDDYIEDGLVLYFDGINNVGSGDNNHDSSSTTWKNLCDTENDGELKGPVWGENCLIFDGINDWVSIGEMNYSDITIEAVVENSQVNDKETVYVGNWQSGGYGLIYNTIIDSELNYQNQFSSFIRIWI